MQFVREISEGQREGKEGRAHADVQSTGCFTVSVTTLFAYFSAICEYFRISF